MDTASNYAKAAPCYRSHAQPQLQCLQQLWQWAALDLSGASALLDVGAGPAPLAAALLAAHPQLHYYALDTSPEMLAQSPPLPNLHCLLANMLAMPLASHSVNVCLSNFALHWASCLPTALAECLRVTQPNGHMVLALPIQGSLQQLPQRYPGFKLYNFPQAAQVIQQLQPHCHTLSQQTMHYPINATSLLAIMQHLRAVGGVINQGQSVAHSQWRSWLRSDTTAQHPLAAAYQVLFVHAIKR